MTSLAIIPARGGSTRLPGKNLRIFRGEPLIAHSIRQGLATCDRVIVTSDNHHILNVASQYGARVFLRSEATSGDGDLEPVIREVLECDTLSKYEKVALLQPTSPLRSESSILRSLEMLAEYDSVIGVTRSPSSYFVWVKTGESYQKLYGARIKTQDIHHYSETGSLYAFRREAFLRDNNRICGNYTCIELPESEALDINTEEDWKVLNARAS